MSSQPSSYDYSATPLSGPRSIRLLVLWPLSTHTSVFGGSTDSLTCALEVASLSSNPIYQAVSYTWGTEVATRQLWVGNAVIPITPNLFDLLVQFRHADMPITLWVDMVCINQRNTAEQSVQIPLMADIYANAQSVLIWLGRGTPETDAVMAFMKRTGASFRARESLAGRFPSRARDLMGEDKSCGAYEDTEIWTLMESDPALELAPLVWNRPWFTRRWIIQELAFARKATLHFGTASIEWDHLEAAVEAISHLGGDGSFLQGWLTKHGRMFHLESGGAVRLQRLASIRANMIERREKPSADAVFISVASADEFECREDKDRVFALLGILNYGREKPFKIDYGLPTKDIYEAFAWYCIEHGDMKDCTDMLSYAGLSAHNRVTASTFGLPSWVPDWRASFQQSTHILEGFTAGHRVAARIDLRRPSNEIVVTGSPIDRVKHVFRPITDFGQPEDPKTWSIRNPNLQARWYQPIEEGFTKIFGPYRFEMPRGLAGMPYILGGTAWEALFKTLVLDPQDLDIVYQPETDLPALGRAAPTEKFPFYEEGTGIRRLLLITAEGKSPATIDPNGVTVMSNEAQEYFARMRTVCEHRSLYVTTKGFIGLGPRETKPGDVVFLPCGASVPYVVRAEDENVALLWDDKPAGEDAQMGYFIVPGNQKPRIVLVRAKKPRFKLIGETYVQGLMRGELWNIEAFYIDELALC